MTRFAALALIAACTTDPAPATLTPSIFVRANDAEMSAGVVFADSTHVADVDATFRGHTWHLGRPSENSSAVNLDVPLDHPLAQDEPLGFTIDGIAMTVTAPPPFDFADVPQFVSRSGSATIRWTMTSADDAQWSTLTSGCVRGGGELAPNATSVTFTPANWLPPIGAPTSDTCTTAVQFTRERLGTVGAPFPGGQIEIDQSADVVFASMP